MPKKCYYKPTRSRKRVFTARDVGRIVCAARSDGAADEDLRTEISKCLKSTDKECEESKDLVTKFAAAGAGVATVLLALIPASRGIKTFLRVMRLVFPTQVERITKILDDTIAESEKTRKILDDIIRRARELEGSPA